MIKCPFCNIDKAKIENTIIEETSNFFVIPAVGALVEGYILIISKNHIYAMSELTIEEMKEYENLINKYRGIFKSIYAKYPIVFEHGSPNINNSIKANSITHAHTHIVNHNYKDEKNLIEDLHFKKMKSIKQIMNKNSDNYIFYMNANKDMYFTNKFNPISQIMRIKIAEDLNKLFEYDWRKNKLEHNIKLTISKISNYLKK